MKLTRGQQRRLKAAMKRRYYVEAGFIEAALAQRLDEEPLLDADEVLEDLGVPKGRQSHAWCRCTRQRPPKREIRQRRVQRAMSEYYFSPQVEERSRRLLDVYKEVA